MFNYMIIHTDDEKRLSVVEMLMEFSKSLFKKSITYGTNNTYTYGWKHWLQMCNLLNVDPLLSVLPRYWVKTNLVFGFGISCFLMFLCYLNIIKKLCPGTVSNYIAGVRYFLASANVDSSFVDTFPYIKKVKVGMMNVYRAHTPEISSKTLPLSCDMFLYGIQYVFNKPTKLHFAISTALCIMRSCLLRASETVPTPQSNHHLLTDDVEFEIKIDNKISFRPSYDISDLVLSCVIGVIINIASAKSDQHGIGHKSPFTKDRHTNGYCLIEFLFKFSKFSKSKKGDPYFSVNSSWVLSYRQLNDAHKIIAKSCGFDTKLFSCKSSRNGGACALSLAGFPDSFIMKAGRWKSLAFLVYVRLCVKAYSDGLKAISDPKVFTMDDVRKLIPSSR